MNKRWKDELTKDEKMNIENHLNCCGFYNSKDDPVDSYECSPEESYTKRSLDSIINGPIYYNSSYLSKRATSSEITEDGCAFQLEKEINSKITIYIITLLIMLILNIAAVILTIMDIKQRADILQELSNPFA